MEDRHIRYRWRCCSWNYYDSGVITRSIILGEFMGIADFFKLAGGLGGGILLVVSILAAGVGLGMLLSRIKGLERTIEGQESKTEGNIDRLTSLLERQEERINYIETHYAEKKDLHQSMGGWRTEIGNLAKRIDEVLLRRE